MLVADEHADELVALAEVPFGLLEQSQASVRVTDYRWIAFSRTMSGPARPSVSLEGGACDPGALPAASLESPTL